MRWLLPIFYKLALFNNAFAQGQNPLICRLGTSALTQLTRKWRRYYQLAHGGEKPRFSEKSWV